MPSKNRAIEDRRNEDRFHFIDWTKNRVQERGRDPGRQRHHAPDQSGKMSPGIQVARRRGLPDTCVGTDSHTRTWMRWA